jgi:hypothetical protein
MIATLANDPDMRRQQWIAAKQHAKKLTWQRCAAATYNL